MKIKSIKQNILDKPKCYYDVINANPYNNFLIKTKKSNIVSHNCFFDEINEKLVSFYSNVIEKPIELLENFFKAISNQALMIS